MSVRAARIASVALVVAVLLAGAGASGPTASAQSLGTIADTQVDPDDVSLRVALQADGSAAWTIEYRVRLDDDNTTRAFESLRDDIAANDTQYVSEFRGRMVATADTAENATGREMRIRNVSVDATRQQLPQEYGVLTYTFVWTNFAAVDDGSITAGDALAGFFLDSETTLQLSWPAGYAVETVQPEPDDLRTESRIAAWNGPVEFGANEPTLVVTRGDTGGSTSTTVDGGDGGGSGGSGDGEAGGNLPVGAIVAVVLAAVVAVGFLYRQRAGSDASGTPDGTAPGDGPPPDSTAPETQPADGDAGAATGTAAAGSADADPGDGSAGADSGGAATPPWEDELLSNQEKVLALVEAKGGRMKQQEVAQTLEWTDAKTSQVVGKMREADELEAFRLGRENVLVLPGEEFGPSDPDDASGE
jgi:hypothetical protein